MLHRASLAVPTLSPPKNGSLRQAALASVQRLQADSASPVNTQSTRKRSYSESDSPNAHSPSNFPPLAQRIRSDLQIGEESPEREQLRTQPTPLKFPSPSSPLVLGFPPPAPLLFTPPKIQEGFETPVSQSGENVVEVEKVSKETAKEVEVEVAKVAEQDSDWETIIEDCERCSEIDSETGSENEFPAIDVDCENWAEKYTTSIRRFHSSGNFSNQTDVKEAKCPNCGGAFSPHHQC